MGGSRDLRYCRYSARHALADVLKYSIFYDISLSQQHFSFSDWFSNKTSFQAPEEVKPTGPSLDLNNMQPGQAQMPVATCTTSGESNLYPMLGLQTSAQADSKTGRNDRKAKTGKQAGASSQEPAVATATAAAEAAAAAATAAAVQAAAAAAAESFLSDKGLIIKTHTPSSPIG